MKIMKWLVVVTAVLGLTFNDVNSQDAGLEFGIEDDLTVMGVDGDTNDPDLEVKGYSVFGTSDGATVATSGVGNVFVSGTLEASNMVVRTITVGENATVSNLNVLGVLSVDSNDDLDVSGGATIGGDLIVNNDTIIGNTLIVSNAATMEDDLLVKGNLMTWGTGTFSNHLGATSTASVGTNATDANTRFQVRGGGASGDFTAKFYANTNLAAWICKK